MIDVVDELERIIQKEYQDTDDSIEPCIHVHVYERARDEIKRLRKQLWDQPVSHTKRAYG